MKSAALRIGLAGWGNPPSKRPERPADLSHPAFYARYFSCVEINSSFYHSHQRDTYARWRDETPARFRFAVKMPRTVTHDSGLRHCAADLARFYGEIACLHAKLAVVLVQLPPSLEYDGRVVHAFFRKATPPRGAKLVCEPRHESWFTAAADELLQRLGVSRVAADPAKVPGAGVPAGAAGFAYCRWHGSPHMYHSKYSEARLVELSNMVSRLCVKQAWCVFDNTARYAAWDDALRFQSLPRRRLVGRH